MIRTIPPSCRIKIRKSASVLVHYSPWVIHCPGHPDLKVLTLGFETHADAIRVAHWHIRFGHYTRGI